jgi:hypothetical protein
MNTRLISLDTLSSLYHEIREEVNAAAVEHRKLIERIRAREGVSLEEQHAIRDRSVRAEGKLQAIHELLNAASINRTDLY